MRKRRKQETEASSVSRGLDEFGGTSSKSHCTAQAPPPAPQRPARAADASSGQRRAIRGRMIRCGSVRTAWQSSRCHRRDGPAPGARSAARTALAQRARRGQRSQLATASTPERITVMRMRLMKIGRRCQDGADRGFQAGDEGCGQTQAEQKDRDPTRSARRRQDTRDGYSDTPAAGGDVGLAPASTVSEGT